MGNCPCAPLGLECVNEKYHKDLMCCLVHILKYHWHESLQSLPLIGEWFEPYYCPDFELEEKRSEVKKNE